MRFAYNDFELRKVTYLDGRDTYPNEIDVVKITDQGYVYSIGRLVWNPKEPCWDFESVGLRYLIDSTKELDNYILDFCSKYKVVNNKLVIDYDEDWGE